MLESVWLSRLGLEWQAALNSTGSVALCNVGAAADSYGVHLVLNLIQKLLKCTFPITALVSGSKLSDVTSSKLSLKIKTARILSCLGAPFMLAIYDL